MVIVSLLNHVGQLPVYAWINALGLLHGSPEQLYEFCCHIWPIVVLSGFEGVFTHLSEFVLVLAECVYVLGELLRVWLGDVAVLAVGYEVPRGTVVDCDHGS